MKKFYIIIILINLLLLVSCLETSNINNPDAIADKFYELLIKRKENFDILKESIYCREDCFVIGKYNKGYVIVVHDRSLEKYSSYFSTDKYEDIILNYNKMTKFYYFIDYSFKRDELYRNLVRDKLNEGLISSLDIKDIAEKLELFKDGEIPYYVNKHLLEA